MFVHVQTGKWQPAKHGPTSDLSVLQFVDKWRRLYAGKMDSWPASPSNDLTGPKQTYLEVVLMDVQDTSKPYQVCESTRPRPENGPIHHVSLINWEPHPVIVLERNSCSTRKKSTDGWRDKALHHIVFFHHQSCSTSLNLRWYPQPWRTFRKCISPPNDILRSLIK